MKRRALGFVLVTALLVAVGAIAAACGDGEEELTLEEYFQRLQTMSDDLNERGEALETELEGLFDPAASEQQSIAAGRRFLDGNVSIIRDGLDVLEDLDPPSQVGDSHNKFVDAANGLRDRIGDLADRAAEVQSAADLEEIFAEFQSPELETIDERFVDACQALERIASENGIQVDLGCE